MKLLIIDDDKGIVQLITRHIAISLAGVSGEVVICNDLGTAWEILRSGRQIDAILLDLVLPPMRAEETIAEIPEMMKFCPRIIVLSGYEKYREAAIARGAIGFISKLGDLDTKKGFLEKMASIFRKLSGPTDAEKALFHFGELLGVSS